MDILLVTRTMRIKVTSTQVEMGNVGENMVSSMEVTYGGDGT